MTGCTIRSERVTRNVQLSIGDGGHWNDDRWKNKQRQRQAKCTWACRGSIVTASSGWNRLSYGIVSYGFRGSETKHNFYHETKDVFLKDLCSPSSRPQVWGEHRNDGALDELCCSGSAILRLSQWLNTVSISRCMRLSSIFCLSSTSQMGPKCQPTFSSSGQFVPKTKTKM